MTDSTVQPGQAQQTDQSTQPPVPTPPPAAPAPPVPSAPAGPGAVKPDGVTDAEWSALGDPGKAAIIRERARATAAEQALAAAKAPPKQDPPPKTKDGEPDIAALVSQAVTAAIAPFQQAQQQRDADAAAAVIRDAVTAAAKDRFHDPSDALQIDLTAITDGAGQADPAKVTAALDLLLTSKPYLGKVGDTRRHAPPGSALGAGGPTQVPMDDRVKASLARMQQAAGVKFASKD